MTKLAKYFSYTLALLGIWFSIFLADVSLSKKSLEKGLINEIETASGLLAMALDETTPMTSIISSMLNTIDLTELKMVYDHSNEKAKKFMSRVSSYDPQVMVKSIQTEMVISIANKLITTSHPTKAELYTKVLIFDKDNTLIYPDTGTISSLSNLYSGKNSNATWAWLNAFLPSKEITSDKFKSTCINASSPGIFKKSDSTFHDFTNDRRIACKNIMSDDGAYLGYIVIQDLYYQAPFWSHLFNRSYLLPFVLLAIIILLLIEAKNTAVRYQIKQISSLIVELGRVKSIYTTPVVPLQLKIDQGFRTLAKSIRRLRKRLEHKETLEIDLQNIAHQLDNNLGSAAGDIENYNAGISTAEETLESSGTKIERVRTLLGRLLDIAHLNTIKHPNYKERVDLTIVISTVINDYSDKIKEKNLTIRSQLTNGVIILGDFDLLVSAFSNILHNAIKHSPDRGEIEFQIKHTNNNIRVLILDGGAGLSESTFNRIENNESFTNQHPSIKEKGHGLGIRHSKAVFQLHNAEFTISNRHFKAGANASVMFYTDNGYTDDDSKDS